MLEGLLQPSHLILIALVAIVMFGPSKIPDLGKGLGEGIKNFKKGMKEATEAVNSETSTPSSEQPTTKV